MEFCEAEVGPGEVDAESYTDLSSTAWSVSCLEVGPGGATAILHMVGRP